ncbi:MAG: outer membrane protein [Pseudohongiellaceae bacterium]
MKTLFTSIVLSLALAISAAAPAIAADKEGPVGIYGATDDPGKKHFSGVFVGVGVDYSTGDRDLSASGDDPELGDVKIEDLNFDIDEFGFRGSILAQSYMFGQTNWVGGIELGGFYSNDLSGAYGHLRLGYDLGRVMPYVQTGVGFDLSEDSLIDGKNSVDLDNVQYNYRLGGGVQWAVTDQIHLDLSYARVWGFGDKISADTTHLGDGAVKFESDRHEFAAQVRVKF